MASSAAAQIMRQANEVKDTMTGSEKSISELWVSRQKLEDLYKRLLVLDLEYALDKKVEQDLWNHAFKNQISALQTQTKDRQNPKKSDAQASLNLFLETASGFYLQFLQMICSTFKLDVPFRRRSVAFGIIKENTTSPRNIVTPKKSSCLYICCYCLVHLGDIARYRQQTEQAQTYYRHAANLSPNNGQPYNQLAILEASRGDKLSTVFYYIRSLAVRHPFPVAATNLEKFYSKLIKDTRSDFDNPNLTVSEIVTAFLQFQALLHMSTGLDRASNLKSRITVGLGSHIRTQTVTAAHLTGMVAISVFGLHRARHDMSVVAASTGGESGCDSSRKKNLSSEEERVLQIHLSFAVKLLETMLTHTPKEDNKAKDFLTLSAIKVLLDWLYLNKDILNSKDFINTSIWSDLCKLLNTQQWLLNECNKASDLQKYEDTPLPEDCDLRCFQPLEPTYSAYNFHKSVGEELSAACERDLRCLRLVAHGKWLAQDLPKLKLVIYQPNKSIRNQFSTQRVAQSSDRQPLPSQKPSQRKNVAMQTILKKQQQRQQLDQDKVPGSSPLSVISEESRPPSVDQYLHASPSQGEPSSVPISANQSHKGGRQAGVISLPHKSVNHKNLPPRLSAKAAANQQNQSISPRMQKKLGGSQKEGHQDASMRHQPDDPSKQHFGSPPEQARGEREKIFPGLGPDNYPALVSSRPPPSVQALSQQEGSEVASSWPGFVFGGQEASTAAVTRVVPPPPPSQRFGLQPEKRVDDCHPVTSHSPQQQQEILAAMQARQQHQQQQQQQLKFYQQQLQQPPPPPAQVFQQQHHHQQSQQQQQIQQQKMHQHPQTHPNQSQQQQQHHHHQQQQQQKQQLLGSMSQMSNVQLSRLYQQAQVSASGSAGGNNAYRQGHISSLPNGQGRQQGPVSHHHHHQNGDPATVMGHGGSGDLPVGPGVSASSGSQQYQGSRRDAAFFAKNSAPVGFIPPPGPAVLSSQGNKGGSGQRGNFPGPAIGGGNFMSNQQVGNQASTSQAPQSLHQHLLQQQQHKQQQHSGLLYQNIPLPGGADIKGTEHKYANPSQMSTLQDARMSASFQGHAAGTPKPEKQQNIPAHFFQQAPPGSLSQLRPQHQASSLSQASMLRSVMGDPPFLQPSGEYTLFSGGSSPAWPTPLGKSGPNPQHGSMPVNTQLRPGNLHGDAGAASAQSLWSASGGPSPLERLLEQQKNWKQTD